MIVILNWTSGILKLSSLTGLRRSYTVQGPGQARSRPFLLALDPGPQGQGQLDPGPIGSGQGQARADPDPSILPTYKTILSTTSICN